jgi:integrase
MAWCPPRHLRPRGPSGGGIQHGAPGGADVRYVQQLLGHESLDTTAIYTQVTINRLIEVHARCHPSARLPKGEKAAESPP